jgi:hypothetical protein
MSDSASPPLLEGAILIYPIERLREQAAIESAFEVLRAA